MIVIHIDTQQDTSFLKKTYEGIDNLNLLYNPTKEQVNKTLEENPNEDVMMLGHGSSSGLFSHDWKGNVIDYSNVHLLKGRNCVGIWCWAKKFAKAYGLKGYFTSMFISNEDEAKTFGFPNATEKEVFDEVEFFAKAINTLIIDNVPYEEWVGKLQGIADMSKPFVEYNYDAMEYFDGTQVAEPVQGTFNFFDYEEKVEEKTDDEVDMWFEDYCYENGIEGDWAREIAYPIFVAGWNSHRYAEQI